MDTADLSKSREEVLTALREAGDRVVETDRSLPPERFDEVRHSDSEWTGKEILAHIASVEWTYPKLLDLARMPAPEGGGPRKAEFRTGIDDYNARQVAKRQEATIEELLEEFGRNREATIAAVESADPELLQQEVTNATGHTGPALEVFHLVGVTHVLDHLEEIAGPG